MRVNIIPLSGEMAEWSKAAVLKTVDPQGSGGSTSRRSRFERRSEARTTPQG